MRGDRERYLAAGMDNFLAKPFERAELLAMLASAAGVSRAVEADNPDTDPEPGADLGDKQRALADSGAEVRMQTEGKAETFDPRAFEQLLRLEKDSPGLLRSLVGRFMSNTPELIAVVAAATGKTANEVEIAAHSLKGTCGRFGAHQLAALAVRAEQAARAGSLAEAQEAGSLMTPEFAAFEQALRRHPAAAEAFA